MKVALFSSQLGIHMPHNMHYHTWLLHRLTGLKSLGAQIFAVTLWKVSYARNQLVFINEKPNPIHIVESVWSLVFEFNAANSPHQQQPVSNAPAVNNPSPNRQGCYIFVTGGCFADGSKGRGMIIRNNRGDLAFAACRYDCVTTDPMLAEAL